MKAIKPYPSRVEADLARIAIDAAGVPSVVVGIGVGMEGGMGGFNYWCQKTKLRRRCRFSKSCDAPSLPRLLSASPRDVLPSAALIGLRPSFRGLWA